MDHKFMPFAYDLVGITSPAVNKVVESVYKQVMSHDALNDASQDGLLASLSETEQAALATAFTNQKTSLRTTNAVLD